MDASAGGWVVGRVWRIQVARIAANATPATPPEAPANPSGEIEQRARDPAQAEQEKEVQAAEASRRDRPERQEQQARDREPRRIELHEQMPDEREHRGKRRPVPSADRRDVLRHEGELMQKHARGCRRHEDAQDMGRDQHRDQPEHGGRHVQDRLASVPAEWPLAASCLQKCHGVAARTVTPSSFEGRVPRPPQDDFQKCAPSPSRVMLRCPPKAGLDPPSLSASAGEFYLPCPP
jgi:hypothetical protein